VYCIDSIISKEHTKNRPTGRNMGFERNGLNMLWAGMPGMRLSSIVPVFESMINCFGFPKAVIILLSG
jgi:hypothetical protein